MNKLELAHIINYLRNRIKADEEMIAQLTKHEIKGKDNAEEQ